MKKLSLRVLVSLALLAAINIVLSRFLVIYLTEFARLDLGNVPLILAGLLFGPIAGALTGAAADITGSALLSGLGWYPPLTLGPVLMGFIPGLLGGWLRKAAGIPRMACVVLTTEFIASILCKTYLLSGLYGMSYYACLVARAPAVALVSAAEVFLVYALYARLSKEFSPLGA